MLVHYFAPDAAKVRTLVGSYKLAFSLLILASCSETMYPHLVSIDLPACSVSSICKASFYNNLLVCARNILRVNQSNASNLHPHTTLLRSDDEPRSPGSYLTAQDVACITTSLLVGANTMLL